MVEFQRGSFAGYLRIPTFHGTNQGRGAYIALPTSLALKSQAISRDTLSTSGQEKLDKNSSFRTADMPSTKGKPSDQKLHDKIKNEIQNETNKDGSGKGAWAAWKATKLAKEYEKAGGGYENTPGSKNQPTEGEPEHKPEDQKEAEVKEQDNAPEDVDDTEKTDKTEKSKANSGKKATGKKGSSAPKAPKEKKTPAEGYRKSARLGSKRSAPDGDEQADEKQEEEEEEKEVEEKEEAAKETAKEKSSKKKAKTATK